MKHTKKIVYVSLLLLGTGVAHADHFSNNIGVIDQQSVDALTKDLGSAIGAGSFHTGKALGFPLGFDVGVHVPVVGVKDEDKVLKDDGSTLVAKWAQAEVGLPFHLNLIGRYGKIEDANAYGGGLRWGILNPSIPGIPAISIAGLYTKATHDDFDAETFSGNVALSFDVPFIHPFIGAGYDHTKLDISDSAPVTAAQKSLSGTQDGYRVEGGINLSLIPFTYITLAGGMANSEAFYHAGLGVNF